MPRVADAAPPPTALPSLSPGQSAAFAQAGTQAAVENAPGASVAAAVRDSQRIGMQIGPALRAGDYKGAAAAFVQSTAAALGAIPGVHLLPGFAGIIQAYHGSPHLFDEFKMSAIGTGEGAQAYGHGLYFAENPAIAGNYQKQLSGAAIDGRPASEVATEGYHLPYGHKPSVEHEIADYINSYGNDPPVLRMMMDRKGRLDLIDAYDKMTADKRITSGGALYSVKLDVNHEDLLDWDKPLSEQSPSVKAALARTGFELRGHTPDSFEIVYDKGQLNPDEPGGVGSVMLAGTENEVARFEEHPDESVTLHLGAGRAVTGADFDAAVRKSGLLGRDLTGADVYSQMKQRYVGQMSAEDFLARRKALGSSAGFGAAEASAALHAAGIPGIRYLDAGSRGKVGYRVDVTNANDKPGTFGFGPGSGRQLAPTVYDSREKAEEVAARTAANYKPEYGWKVEVVPHDTGTRNVVMFDPSLIKIEAVNGQPVPSAAARAADGLSILAHPEAWGMGQVETVPLYHGTSEEAATAIKASGQINGPAYFTPRKDIAEDFGEVALKVNVPKSDLGIDLDMPGGRLLSVEEANGLTGNDGWTIDDYLRAGHSVGSMKPVKVRP